MAADDWVQYANAVFAQVHADKTLGAAAASIVCAELHAFLLAFCDAMNWSKITVEHIKASAERALATGSGDLAKHACNEIVKVCASAPYQLTFSVDSVRSEIVKARPQLAKLDREAAAGLTILIEYLAAEIFELAGNAALDEPATDATAQTRIAYCPADDLARFDAVISTVIVRECHVRQAVAYDDELRGIFPRLGLLEGSAGADGSGSLSTAGEAQPMDVSASYVGASTPAAASASSQADASNPGAVTPGSGVGALSSGVAAGASRTVGSGAATKAVAGADAVMDASIDVRDRFKRAASLVQLHGSFAVDGVFEFVQPLLKVDEMDEPLAFPLLASQAEELKQHAEATRLGHFVPSSRLGFGSRAWAPAVQAIVPAALKGLGVDAAASRVTTKPRGLLLCSASGPSTDPAPATQGVFGTLEVSLPSVRGGGGLKLRHAGDESKELAPRDAADAAVRCHYAAFYSVCQREALPLQEGCRLTLVYDLIATGQGAEDRLEPPSQAKALTHFSRLARSWAGQSTGPRKLCYFLEHRTASWAKLQGKDAALAEALAAAEDEAGKAFDIQLVHITARKEDYGSLTFNNTWAEGPTRMPPTVWREITSGGVEISSNEFVQGEKYWSGQKHDESEEEEEDSEDDYGYGYDRYDRYDYHDRHRPRVLLYARDAIVLWPRSARLEVVTARRGLGFVVSALSTALLHEAARRQLAKDAFLGFGNSLELLTAMIRLQREKGVQGSPSHRVQSQQTLLSLVTAPGVPFAHFAAFVASSLLCDMTEKAEAKDVAKHLLPAVKRHGYKATQEPLSSCLTLATAEGENEARHAGAWQLLQTLSASADPSLAEAPPDGAREVCAHLAAALAPSLTRSASDAPAAKSISPSHTAAAALLVALRLGNDSLINAVTSAIVANGGRFKASKVLSAMGRVREGLPTPPALPALANVVISRYVGVGGLPPKPSKKPPPDLSLFVNAGLADECIPPLVMRQQPESPRYSGFLPALSKLLEDPRRKEAVVSSPALGQLLINVTRRSGPPSAPPPPLPGQPHTLVLLYTAALKFDAAATRAGGAPGRYRDEIAAIVASWPALANVLRSLPALHAALDADSRQHASFIMLLQAGEESVRAQLVPQTQFKDWSLSVNLGCSCRYCAQVQEFLLKPSIPADKEFTGEAYVHRGHTTIIAQAAAARPGSGFTCQQLSSKGAKKFGRLAIRKTAAGQASPDALARQQAERAKAKADAELLKQLQTFRAAIDEVRLSKQPPVDVCKYERMLRALGSDPAGVRPEACDQQTQQQLPTPMEAANLAAMSAGTAAASLVPASVGGANLLEWAASHFRLEGERLSEWVAGHFDPSLRPAIVKAIDEAEVADLAVLASLSRAELCESLLGDAGAPDPVTQPGVYLGMRELELELRRLSLAADDGGMQPGIAVVHQIEAPSRGVWAPARTAERPFTVVVAGDTGTGKSTLLNALLGYEILPTSCCRACTAAVIDASWGAWGASVQFISEEEWMDACTAACAAQARAGPGNAPAADDPSIVDYQRVRAVYGTNGPALDDPASLLRHPMEAERIGRVVSLVPSGETDMDEGLATLVQPYVDSPDDANSGALWPLVKQVSLRGPFGVTVGGVRLCDVPGLHDSNAARNGVMRSFLEEADALLIVSSITRAVNDKGAKELMPLSLRTHLLEEGELGELAFVASKSDNLVVTEVQENLQLPPSTGLAACVAARNAYTRASITRDFYDGQPTNLYPANRPPAPATAPWDETLRFELPVFTLSARDSLKLEGVVTGDVPVLATPAETEVPALRAYIGLAAAAHHARVARCLPDDWTRVGALLLRALEERERQAAGQAEGGAPAVGGAAVSGLAAGLGAANVTAGASNMEVETVASSAAVGKRPAASGLPQSEENIPTHDGVRPGATAACSGSLPMASLSIKQIYAEQVKQHHGARMLERRADHTGSQPLTTSVHGMPPSGPAAKKARTSPPAPAENVIDLCDSD
jgi:GTPase SAR1 family protein